MKTFAEQVAALKATREAKQEELKAVAQKSIDEQRSMDTAEAEQFDTLEAEIKRLDDDIARLSRLAEIDKQTAKAVGTEGREETPIHKSVGTAPVQVKNTEKLEPGVAFARIARCKALSRLENVSPVDIAKTLYPGDDRLVSGLVSKTGVGAANTISGNETWAGNL